MAFSTESTGTSKQNNAVVAVDTAFKAIDFVDDDNNDVIDIVAASFFEFSLFFSFSFSFFLTVYSNILRQTAKTYMYMKGNYPATSWFNSTFFLLSFLGGEQSF